MAEKWVQVKDDPDIIVAEVDESIEILGNVTFFYNALIDDEDDHEEIMPINQNFPVPSFLDAESSVLMSYTITVKV